MSPMIRAGKWADQIFHQITDSTQFVADRFENVRDKIERWSDIGNQSREISSETIQICNQTKDQHKAMIDFATEIQSTLQSGLVSKNGNNKNGAAILTIIKDLTSGDKVRAAMNIATGLGDVATKCVEQSIQLSHLMDQGIEELPKFIRNSLREKNYSNNHVDRSWLKEHDGTDPMFTLLRDLENDILDIGQCIDAIKHLNLKTALKVGMQAFVELSEKSKRCHKLFDAIQSFASDVQTVTHSFNKEKLRKQNAISTVKDVTKSMLNIIRSTSLMKLMSEGAGKLLQCIVSLFEITSTIVSKLWSGLAYAKDCMMDCLEHVLHAKNLCIKSKDTATNLVEKSISVSRQLDGLTNFDMKALQSLLRDGDIQQAISLASRIDDELLDCTTQSIRMIERVKDGFTKIPAMLTESLDVNEAGRSIEDPDIPDIERELFELESCCRSLEDADFVSAPNAGIRGFNDVSNNTEKCLKMISVLETFISNCDTTINSFLSVWDLESATIKINEMCRMVTLGELMERYAGQIQRLMQAMIRYMRTALKKFGKSKLIPNTEAIGKILDNSKDTILGSLNAMKDTFARFQR